MSTTTDTTFTGSLNAEALRELASITEHPCVTLLMPTHRSGSDTRQNAIRFGNLLKEAKEKLAERKDSAAMLRALEEIKDDSSFWQHQSEGLGIFVTEQSVQLYRLPNSVEQAVVVGDNFYLKPLVAMADRAMPFRLLALSWDRARLFQVDASGVTAIETDDLPADYHQLVTPRDPEQQLQYTTHRSGGGEKAMFHGQGNGEEKIEADRKNYLIRVSDAVADVRKNTSSNEPLVLVATGEVAGHFAALSDLKVDAHIEASPSHVDNYTGGDTSWIAEAREQLSGSVEGRLAEIVERLGTAIAQDQGSDAVEQIVASALQGRIDTLLVATHARVPGTVDPANQKVKQTESQDTSVDLINEAVFHALRSSSTVMAVEATELPDRDSSLAAIYRF
jgi:hypothetical protein